MLYQVLNRMIERGDTQGLAEKISVFFAVGQLLQEEYLALEALLSGEDKDG